jgi:hypothetical protein
VRILCLLAGFAGIAYAVIDENAEYRGRNAVRANGEKPRPSTKTEKSHNDTTGGRNG